MPPHSDLDLVAQIHQLLAEVIVPNLASIQASQAQQRLHDQQMDVAIEEFRAEMVIRLAELRTEIAVFRNQVEDTIAELRDALQDATNAAGRRPLIH
jgi:hypothetical protein